MKKRQINLHHLSMPLRSPFETSFGRIDMRECILIEVEQEGLVGWGECVADRDPGYSYETSATAWYMLKEFLIPAVIGEKIQNPSEVQSLTSFVRGHQMAKAGLEMAFWDLVGKQKGSSLKVMIGGRRDQVEVGVSVGLQPTADDLVKTVADYLEQGYGRIKIKIKPGRDFNDTRAVREAFPEVRLQVDANSAYDLRSAQTLLPLDDMNLLLIEQPLADDDLWDHSQLQKSFQTPICLDESILSVRHARQAIEMGACKVINIKCGRVGGITEALAIHSLCYQEGVPVWCGGMLETGVGRAANLALASLPGFSLPGDISATDRYYETDIIQERFRLSADSTIKVPEGPGLGVEVDRSVMKGYCLASLSIPSD